VIGKTGYPEPSASRSIFLHPSEELARFLLEDPEAARCEIYIRLFEELAELRDLNEKREPEKAKHALEVQVVQQKDLLKAANMQPAIARRGCSAASARRRRGSTTSGHKSACDFRPPTFSPVPLRLRSRAPRSLATRRAFSYSINAPATCRIILRPTSSLSVRSSPEAGSGA
jgi:hypothetical protein